MLEYLVPLTKNVGVPSITSRAVFSSYQATSVCAWVASDRQGQNLGAEPLRQTDGILFGGHQLGAAQLCLGH